MALTVAALVIAYCISLYLIEWRVRAAAAPLMQGVPLALIGKPTLPLGWKVQAGLGILAVAESALLFRLYALLKGTIADFRAYLIVASGIVILAASSLATSFTSSDIYHYMFYGSSASLGEAYQEVREPIYKVGFHGLATVVAPPVVPSIYGPLWQQFDREVVSHSDSLSSALFATRLASLIALIIAFGALILARAKFATVAVLALNPGLYYSFVVQAHNDVWAILATVLGVAALVRRQLWIAVILLILAAAVKINFLLVGVSVLRMERSRNLRCLGAIGIVAGSIAVSYLFGKVPYLHAMLTVGAGQVAEHTSRAQELFRHGLSIVFVCLMLVVLGYGLALRRGYRWGALVFPGVSGLLHPWYFGWGFSYALTGDGMARTYATALPILMYLTDTSLTDATLIRFGSFVLVAIAVALIGEIAGRRRERGSGSPTAVFE